MLWEHDVGCSSHLTPTSFIGKTACLGGFSAFRGDSTLTVPARINAKVGFRLITKFGSTGIINLGKLVPGVGAAIGGGLDLAETKVIGNRAYK